MERTKMFDEKTKKGIKEVFGDTIDHSVIDNIIDEDQETLSPRERQERIIVSVAETGSQPLSEQLYELVAQEHIQNIWTIESLAPIPLLSKVAGKDDTLAFDVLFQKLMVKPGAYRIVAAWDQVIYGTIGTTYHMVFGSTGSVVGDVLKGCLALPQNCSWVDAKVASILGLSCDKWTKVGFHNFTGYTLPSGSPVKR